jgi:preprotein translocase subunit SecA
VIYEERHKILEGLDLHDEATEMVVEVVKDLVAQHINPDVFPEEWDLDALVATLNSVYPTALAPSDLKEEESAIALEDRVLADALEAYDEKERQLGTDEASGLPILRELERMVLLSFTDNTWREHLYDMDNMQEGIGLRAYGQRDPLVEYQREAYAMFDELKTTIRDEFVRYIYRVELIRQDQQTRAPQPQRVMTHHADDESGNGAQGAAVAVSDKIPRNAPCPCGSGRKYKKCHGMTT